MVPVTVNETVSPADKAEETTVPVTTMQASYVTETVPVTNTVLVPEQRTEMMPTTQYRQVTENFHAASRRSGSLRSAGDRCLHVKTKQVTENVTQQVASSGPLPGPPRDL